jgi:hypothetical protein
VPEYAWMLLGEGLSEFLVPTFSLDRYTDERLARSLHGLSVITLYVAPNNALAEGLGRFGNSLEMQEEYIGQHRDQDLQEVFRDFKFRHPKSFSHYEQTAYDAVIALGIAACECEQDLFTGTELYEQLLKTEFDGVSGRVSFDPVTGTRRSVDFQYRIQNLLISDVRSTNEEFMFTSWTASMVDLRNNTVMHARPFIYPDSSTTPPIALPAMTEDYHLISPGALACGLSFAGFAIVLSIGYFTWTLLNRSERVVRSSQPIFLCMICVGTFLVACSVFPLALQEPVPVHVLDISCMLTPWFLSVGLAIAISALVAKTWRLNKVLCDGNAMRHITVKARDVMLPFCLLMAIDVALLTGWSVVAPLTWQRTTIQMDKWGRSIESYGMCMPESSKMSKVAAFAASIVALNGLVLLAACWQAYKGRNVATKFNESTYICVAMCALTEVLLLAIPLALVVDNPTTHFLLQSILFSLACFAILLPIFVPKCIKNNGLVKQASIRISGLRGQSFRIRQRLTRNVSMRLGGLLRSQSRPNLMKSRTEMFGHDGQWEKEESDRRQKHVPGLLLIVKRNGHAVHPDNDGQRPSILDSRTSLHHEDKVSKGFRLW